MIKASGELVDDSGERGVVRMFPDYANTVVWFNGPVDYEDSGLSPDLVLALEAWEQAHYDGLTSNFTRRPSPLAQSHQAEGDRLAARVADELGSGYEVEHGYTPPRRFRSRHDRSDTPAAAAFDALAAAQPSIDERLAYLIANDKSTGSGWSAHTPLSGGTFTPDG